METPLTDERIMAYVDGELSPEEADKVRDTLARDPDALERAEIFKKSAAMLQGVYDAPLNEAVPRRLTDTVRNDSRQKERRQIGDLLSAFFSWPRWSPAQGLALLIALACGIGTGYFAFHRTIPPGNAGAILFAGDPLSRALETTPSGKPFSLADGSVEITPVATFRYKNQRYCRQYEAEKTGPEENGLIHGVACRSPSGQWRTFIEMTVTPVDTPTEKTAGYAPAGQDDLFSDLVEKTMATPPLSLDREATLIDRNWH